MSSDLQSKTVLCYDNGLFVEWAAKFVGSFGRVLYYSPFKSAFPKSLGCMVGDEIPGVERVRDLWDVVDEVDIFFFPDVYDGDLQLYLREKGKAVWGCGKGEELELYRYETKQYLKSIGLSVQPVQQIVGLDNLRVHLQKVKNKWVKLSYFRGDMETFHHENYDLSEPRLDELEYKLGARKTVEKFVIEDAIDGVEAGYDGFTIDGKFPKVALQGYEIKDLGLVGMVKPYAEFPKQIVEVNTKLSEAFRKYQYRGFWSSEVRITKEGIGYLTDPCCRAGSPPNELYLELYSNWPEVVWGGAHGELVELNPVAKYGVEVMIHSAWADKNWQAVRFPKEIASWVKLRNLTILDGTYYIVPHEVGLPEIGAVIGIDDTLLGAIKKVKSYAEQIQGYLIEIKMDSIGNGIEVIREGIKTGITFGELPSVEEVAKIVA